MPVETVASTILVEKKVQIAATAVVLRHLNQSRKVFLKYVSPFMHVHMSIDESDEPDFSIRTCKTVGYSEAIQHPLETVVFANKARNTLQVVTIPCSK